MKMRRGPTMERRRTFMEVIRKNHDFFYLMGVLLVVLFSVSIDAGGHRDPGLFSYPLEESRDPDSVFKADAFSCVAATDSRPGVKLPSESCSEDERSSWAAAKFPFW